MSDAATSVQSARTPAQKLRAGSRPDWLSTIGAAFGQKRARVGGALVAVIVLVAFVGPLFAPHTESALVGPPYAAPSASAALGTDYLGHDVLSRVLLGGRSVIELALAATLLGMLIGVAVGLIAGYSRSLLGDLLMGAADILLAFPQIVLVVLFVSVLGPQLWLIALITALSHAPRVARVTRGVTAEVVNRDFVQAAELIGTPRRAILGREILPNLTTPLAVEFGLRLTWSIAIVAAISFLGFGLQPPAADWGLMLNENRNGLTLQPWAVLMPVLMIALLTIGVNLVAEAIARASSGIEKSGGT